MMKVLIVDDEVDSWFLLSALLRKHQLVAKFANSLNTAEQCMDERDYPVVFIDSRVQSGSVNSFTQCLRNRHPAAKIIYITEGNNPAPSSFASAADFVLHRPFTTYNIEEILQKLAWTHPQSN